MGAIAGHPTFQRAGFVGAKKRSRRDQTTAPVLRCMSQILAHMLDQQRVRAPTEK
jgi:hypothetical protein